MPLGDLVIAPQFPFGGRILDLLIIADDGTDTGNKKLLNVECDGAEYHTHNVSMADYRDAS